MSIINIKQSNFNTESIRISPAKVFAYKNEYFTENSDHFLKRINLSQLEEIEKINIDTNESEYLYGLTSNNAFQQSQIQSAIREINLDTRKRIINSNNEKYNLFQIFSGSICSCDQNDQNCTEKFELSKPIINSFIDNKSKNIELESRYFGIKRITNELKFFSRNLEKKKIIKQKLYSTHSTLSDSNYHQSFQYGFYNYNCLNFFSICPSTKILNSEVLSEIDINQLKENTHSMCLLYSNKKLENKNIFPNENGELTLNFWINPKNREIKDYYYNPGCIINIPNLFSIFIVENENSKNEKNLPDKFFILMQLGENSNTNNPRKFVTNRTFQTSNILKLNNWHNITINLYKNKIKVSIDDQYEVFYFDSNELNLTNNYESIITIGNKLNYSQNVYQYDWESSNNIRTKLFNQLTFSKYSLNKNEIYLTNDSNNLVSNILEDLNCINTKVYSLSENDIENQTDESCSLHAELQGFMILSDDISNIVFNDFYNGKYDDLLKNENIKMYIPCSYLSVKTNKISHITLGEIQKIGYYSYANPYFSNKINGHELSVENFVIDIISKRKPLTLGMDSTVYKDSFTTIENNDSLYLKQKKRNILYKLFKYHNTPNQIYNQIFSDDIFFIDEKFNVEKFLKNNLIYRNNFILPCDNGLNKLNLDKFIKEKFINEYKNIFYKNEDINHVRSDILFENIQNEIFEKPLSFFQNDFFSKSLIDDYSDGGFLLKNISTQNISGFESIFQTIILDKNNELNIEKNCYSLDLDLDFDETYKNYEKIFTNIKSTSNKKYTINSIFKNIDDETNENNFDSIETIDFASGGIVTRNKKYYCSNYSIEGEIFDTHSVIFEISNKLYSSKIRKENVKLYDFDIAGTGGAYSITLKDNGRGLMYRSDCLTPHAKWNYVGHIFYNEGLINILHPGLSSFGENNFICELKGDHKLFTHEINIPVEKGELNRSVNKSYKKLRPSTGLYDLTEEDFVYITGINLHDENLNIVARANFAQPIVKRQNDRYNFRLKMDF